MSVGDFIYALLFVFQHYKMMDLNFYTVLLVSCAMETLS